MPAADAARLLDGLDPSQRDAVTATAAPLAILAGAGSGKTRVLTHRIAYQAAVGAISAERVLAVTFTRKAAAELRSRLARLGVRGEVTAGTFHAVALAQLRQRAADAGRELPALVEWKGRVLSAVLPGRTEASRVLRNEVAAEIEWAKARLVNPSGYAAAVAAAGREPPRPADEVARWYAAYEKEKQRRRLWDFDDLLWQCTRALETEPEFADVQRWRFRHLFVDEFQDATHAQIRLLRGWLGDRPDLCVVGDPDQAIYGFAGADPDYLDRFAAHFPGGATVRLDRNYRSTPQIVRAARSVLPPAPRPPVHATAPDGPPPVLHAVADDRTEADRAVDLVRQAHGARGTWGDAAVLYRTNAQSARFEQAFGRAGIPVRVRGDRAFLERPEVRAVFESLREHARRVPSAPLATHLTDLTVEADELPEERREHVAQVVALGREYLAAEGGTGSVAGFEAYLTASLRHDAGGGEGDAVELLTFHRAKGLEWDTVVVCGLERGLVPISHAEGNPAELAEERRLLYVALSRARRVLHLTWAAERALGSRTAKRRPSPWLADIERSLPRSEPVPAGAEARTGPARARARLAAIDGGDVPLADRPLYDALVDWRRDVARAADVPAYVVFDNKTLRALARERPRSQAALLAVSGVGPTKLERYGAAVLELVEAHAVE